MARLVILILLSITLLADAQQPLNILTFNIRYDNKGDSLNAWPHRKEKVISQILFHESDIIGVQEALAHQVSEMQQGLPGYSYLGVGRTDGKDQGEYCAVFYKKDRVELIKGNTFWLSTEPNVPGSKGWDAAITCIVTWAEFRDRRSGKIFYLFNTHFDHMGKEARKQSAFMVLRESRRIAGNKPYIVTGDFNAHPDDEPIMIIMDSTKTGYLTDSKLASAQPHYGPTGTFNGFGPKETDQRPIDYIFIHGNVRVLQHATLSQTWNGRFSSDHFPVFARVVIK